MDENKEYLTIAQAARMLGQKPRTFQLAIKRGKLNGLGLLVKIPGLSQPRVDKARLLEFIEKNRI